MPSPLRVTGQEWFYVVVVLVAAAGIIWVLY